MEYAHSVGVEDKEFANYGLTKSNTKIKSRVQPHHFSFGSQCCGIGRIADNVGS
jgi:hypothetical protein